MTKEQIEQLKGARVRLSVLIIMIGVIAALFFYRMERRFIVGAERLEGKVQSISQVPKATVLHIVCRVDGKKRRFSERVGSTLYLLKRRRIGETVPVLYNKTVAPHFMLDDVVVKHTASIGSLLGLGMLWGIALLSVGFVLKKHSQA